jgi:hypothetical protein
LEIGGVGATGLKEVVVPAERIEREAFTRCRALEGGALAGGSMQFPIALIEVGSHLLSSLINADSDRVVGKSGLFSDNEQHIVFHQAH